MSYCHRPRRFPGALALVAMVCATGALAGPVRAQTGSCPIAPDPAALPDAANLQKMNAFVARLGLRPTGSGAHVRYVGWIRRRLRTIAGGTSSELEYPIERWIPGETAPRHGSFGGEGTPYDRHLLPTVGVIAAPQSLYDPAFGSEGIDFDVMRDEVLGFTELVNRLGTMEQRAIAGDVPAERARRSAGAPPCPEAN